VKGEELTRKLVRLFLDTAKSELESIHDQIEKGSQEDLAHSLHKLKGGCGTIGARAMAVMVLEMERQLLAGKPETMPSWFAKLEREFANTEELMLAKT